MCSDGDNSAATRMRELTLALERLCFGGKAELVNHRREAIRKKGARWKVNNHQPGGLYRVARPAAGCWAVSYHGCTGGSRGQAIGDMGVGHV